MFLFSNSINLNHKLFIIVTAYKRKWLQELGVPEEKPATD